MKEFFKKCLKNLKLTSGLDQLHWMQQECDSQAEFDANKEILFDSMMIVSKKFDYIPKDKQQEYITRMLSEDQEFKSFDSRIVWKWLNLHKDKHSTVSTLTEDDLTQKPIAPPEVADEYIRQMNENIKNIGNIPKVNGMKILRESKGYKEGVIARDPRPKWIVGEDCDYCKGKGFYMITSNDIELKEPCLSCDLTGKKEPRFEVYAVTREEADKAYRAHKEIF